MINRTRLLADLKLQVRDLEGDLRERFGTVLEYKQRLTADWQAARDAGQVYVANATWNRSAKPAFSVIAAYTRLD